MYHHVNPTSAHGALDLWLFESEERGDVLLVTARARTSYVLRYIALYIRSKLPNPLGNSVMGMSLTCVGFEVFVHYIYIRHTALKAVFPDRGGLGGKCCPVAVHARAIT